MGLDLYSRLEQIQGVRHVLLEDVRCLEKLVVRDSPVEIDSESAGIHRHYVRAVFALIEAVVEQHRLLLLDLADAAVVSLDSGAAQRLRDKQTLRQRIMEVYRAAGHAFGQPVEVECEPLMVAKKVRDRLTQPKSFQECDVFVLEIDKVKQAEDWFRHLNNRFVRVAEEHREAHDHWRAGK
jgi:hypothetical protein